jgi:His/Glu/Gln/Arg/opine family amino acid ABC transporter permease subunit
MANIKQTPIQESFAKRYRARFGHLPWFKRYEYLIPLSIIILLIGLLLLPPLGKPAPLQWLWIGVFLILLILWVVGILTDIEKPRWIRAIAAISFVFVLGFFFYRYSGAQWDKLTTNFFNLSVMEGLWGDLGQGLLMTLKVALVSMCISLALGLVIAILRSLNNPILNVFLIIYIDFFRAIPLIVLVVFVFYALPFLGIELDPYISAVVAVSLSYAAYVAEVIRAGIESIYRGQVEASRALGLSSMQTMRLVILPQAVRVVIPPTTGLMVGLLKDTALTTIIGLPELLYKGIQNTIWQSNPTPLVAAAVLYILVLLPLTRFSGYLETRSKKWVKTAR